MLIAAYALASPEMSQSNALAPQKGPGKNNQKGKAAKILAADEDPDVQHAFVGGGSWMPPHGPVRRMIRINHGEESMETAAKRMEAQSASEDALHTSFAAAKPVAKAVTQKGARADAKAPEPEIQHASIGGGAWMPPHGPVRRMIRIHHGEESMETAKQRMEVQAESKEKALRTTEMKVDAPAEGIDDALRTTFAARAAGGQREDEPKEQQSSFKLVGEASEANDSPAEERRAVAEQLKRLAKERRSREDKAKHMEKRVEKRSERKAAEAKETAENNRVAMEKGAAGAEKAAAAKEQAEKEAATEKAENGATAKAEKVVADSAKEPENSSVGEASELQVDAPKQTEAGGPKPQRRKIGWLHIPKAGTSFGTALAHLANSWALEDHPESVKPLPVDAQMKDCAVEVCHTGESRDFAHRFPFEQYYPNTFWFPWGQKSEWGAHTTLRSNNGWPDYKGHMFSMFRKPESLAESALKYFGKARRSGLTLKQYSEKVWGTTTSMLTGQTANGLQCLENPLRNRCPWQKFKVPDLRLAIQRLDDFAFVGLTEEWALSICLLHAQHGGKCRKVELANSRNTSNYWLEHQMSKNDDALRTTDTTNATYDPYDGELYKAVKKRFWADVKRAGLWRKGCEAQLVKDGCMEPGFVMRED